jgi:hypothetical protein
MIHDRQGLPYPLRHCWTRLQTHENGVQENQENNEMLHRRQVDKVFNFDTPLGAVFDLHGGHEFTQERKRMKFNSRKTSAGIKEGFPRQSGKYTHPNCSFMPLSFVRKVTPLRLKVLPLSAQIEHWDKIYRLLFALHFRTPDLYKPALVIHHVLTTAPYH